MAPPITYSVWINSSKRKRQPLKVSTWIFCVNSEIDGSKQNNQIFRPNVFLIEGRKCLVHQLICNKSSSLMNSWYVTNSWFSTIETWLSNRFFLLNVFAYLLNQTRLTNIVENLFFFFTNFYFDCLNYFLSVNTKLLKNWKLFLMFVFFLFSCYRKCRYNLYVF